MPTPLALTENLQAARLDGLKVTVRGVPFDAIVDTILRHYPGSTFERIDKSAALVPRRFDIRTGYENQVNAQHEPASGDFYIAHMGPGCENLQAAMIELAATFPAPLKPTRDRRRQWQACVRVRQVDARIDAAAPGLFARLVSEARRVTLARPAASRPTLHTEGDWTTPPGPDRTPDMPGQTLYIGARKATRCRLYEKGKQLRDQDGITAADPHLVRIETEMHPQDAQAFDALHYSAPLVFCASATAVHLATVLGCPPAPVTPSRATTGRTRVADAIASLARNAAPTFAKLTQATGSPSQAALVLAYAFLQADPTGATVQRHIDAGLSATELQALALHWIHPEHEAG